MFYTRTCKGGQRGQFVPQITLDGLNVDYPGESLTQGILLQIRFRHGRSVPFVAPGRMRVSSSLRPVSFPAKPRRSDEQRCIISLKTSQPTNINTGVVLVRRCKQEGHAWVREKTSHENRRTHCNPPTIVNISKLRESYLYHVPSRIRKRCGWPYLLSCSTPSVPDRQACCCCFSSLFNPATRLLLTAPPAGLPAEPSA